MNVDQKRRLQRLGGDQRVRDLSRCGLFVDGDKSINNNKRSSGSPDQRLKAGGEPSRPLASRFPYRNSDMRSSGSASTGRFTGRAASSSSGLPLPGHLTKI